MVLCNHTEDYLVKLRCTVFVITDICLALWLAFRVACGFRIFRCFRAPQGPITPKFMLKILSLCSLFRIRKNIKNSVLKKCGLPSHLNKAIPITGGMQWSLHTKLPVSTKFGWYYVVVRGWVGVWDAVNQSVIHRVQCLLNLPPYHSAIRVNQLLTILNHSVYIFKYEM